MTRRILLILKKILKKNGVTIAILLSLVLYLEENRIMTSGDNVFLVPEPASDVVGGEYKKALDPTQITHVYQIGKRSAYGRSNNQLLTILHAIDQALDEYGDLPNNHAVVAIQGWAFDILKNFFFNGSNSTEFHLQLEALRPVVLVHSDRLDALGLTESKHNKSHVQLQTTDAYYYVKKNTKKLTPAIIKNRRLSVVGALLRNGIAEKNLVLYNAIQDDIMEKQNNLRAGRNERIPYVTIHSRWLEGECEARVGSILPKDECWMTPSYIKAILGNTLGDRPIVLIGDGQKKEVVENLKNDADIGPHLIVAEEIATRNDSVEIPQPWSDMAIAIMSDTFIGTRVSTFATVCGMFRVVRGADPASNFIYTSRDEDNEQQSGGVDICEDCLFLCDKDQSHICGNNVVYS